MRKFLFIFVTTLFICQSVPATSPPPDDWRIFQVREIPPSFPGGSAALVEWITKHLRYPVLAEEQGLEGHVLAAFWVTADGSVKHGKIVRSGGELFDNEVLRVLRFMPRWVPGRENGRAVSVRYTIPFVFRLESDSIPKAFDKKKLAKDQFDVEY